jgi:hypothetical protein
MRGPVPIRQIATVRLANGFLGPWLPGVWELPRSSKSAPIRLDWCCLQHVVLDIVGKDADSGLANLQRHGVRYYGPRVKENGEVHLDFEDPDGHLLEY